MIQVVREDPVASPGPPRLELASWRDTMGVVAGITTRSNDGNMGFGTPEPAEKVSARWRAFLASQRPRFVGAALSHQVHGARIAIHRGAPEAGLLLVDGFDGHVTVARGLLLAITVADCVPVYLAHPGARVGGVVHCGWRGVVAGALEACIASVAALAGGSAPEIVMHCGVGICGDCYEVGPEVIEAVTGKAAAGPGPLDLRAELARRAGGLGVTQISVSDYCAAHDAGRFYSHRRSRGTDGRMLAYAGWPVA